LPDIWLHRLGTGFTAKDIAMDSVDLTHVDAETQAAPLSRKSALMEWFLHDIFYISMLVLALVGVVFRLPVSYWVILMPVFGAITIAEGWKHFANRAEQLGLVYRVGLNWCALLLAIYLLSNSGVSGVMNMNATSLSMMTLLALGTFIAGVQARVWQICAVGSVLFLAVPGLGWLDQSPLLITAATALVVALGGLAWWVTGRAKQPSLSGDHQP
jgi:hypothetical protein